MSLTQVSTSDIVKQQYIFKLKAFPDLFNRLFFMLIVGLLFSLGGIGQQGLRGMITVDIYSADFIIIFTIIWTFIIAIQLTTKLYRNQIVPFVHNQITSFFSDMLFLLTASGIGAIFSLLSHFILLAIVRFLMNHKILLGAATNPSIGEILLGFIATIITIFTFSAIGYMFGMLVQRNKVFSFILPAIFIGGFLMLVITGNEFILNSMHKTFKFYFFETNFFLFALKFLITAGIFYSFTYLISRRMEVAR
ncbi:MAG TPA: hypothetical protein VK061_09760 [Bacillota bacterium]|nr:hypothetical protein [Bacillota bacterium]